MQIKKKKLLFAMICSLYSLNSCSKGPDPIDSGVKTDGTLSFTATTSSYSGEYAPDHVEAIWVESSSGTFVKTLLVKASERKQHLTKWLKATPSGNATDAQTGATIRSHVALTVSWNGKNTSGVTVGDGAYKVCVEFNEGKGTSKYASFSFTKGLATDTQSPSSASNISAQSLTWTPAAK